MARDITRAVAAALVVAANALAGCAVGATQEWSLVHRDEEPRVTRASFANALVEEGLLYGVNVVVAERESGVEARSGAIIGGYGWADLLQDHCLSGLCWVGVNLLGVTDIGRPPLVYSNDVLAGFGGRIELALSSATNNEQEIELVTVRPELVATVDARLWTAEGYRLAEVTAGIGLRLAIVSEGGPPLMKWLKLLLP